MKGVEEQLAAIRRGTAAIIPEGELEEKLRAGRPLRVKLGVDPTAPDIHLGHTVPLQKLRQFQDLGHHAVLIIGDYTAMIGDPSGRSATRPQLTHEQVIQSAASFQQQVFKVLDRNRVDVVFNGSWFARFSFKDVMRLCGQYTVARMLERDDFAKRMEREQPIGIHEFLYPLMQAHDSVEVRADVELGGTDQTFNILLGRHLQREAGCGQQVAVVTPLLEGTDGVQKMSKSLGNYIGIAEPPEQIFGKVMSISDELMMRYYELLTSEDMEGLRRELERGLLHPMEAKKRLAVLLVSRFHGADAALAARQDFELRFQRRELPDEMETFVWAEEADTVSLPAVLVAAGFVKSMSEARRIIQQGGVRVDGDRVRDIHHLLRRDRAESIVQVGSRRVKKIVFLLPPGA